MIVMVWCDPININPTGSIHIDKVFAYNKKSVKYPSEANKLEIEDQIITGTKLGYESHLVYSLAHINNNTYTHFFNPWTRQFTITSARWGS